MEVKKRILVVDDEEPIRYGVRTYLELEGYEVEEAASAEEVLRLDVTRYDLILLDVMMGAMSGVELAAELKRNRATAGVPVIFLTARDDVDEMVAALKLGADDYIAKPFDMKNVLARVEAVLRRTGGSRPKGINCNRETMQCLVDGVAVKLPRKEFELLALFLENRGRIFTREELLSRIWEQTVIVDRSVDVHITRLRSKIAPYGRFIVTRSGYGYGWQD